ncbi:MAG: glycosyltransferase family 4 protein [Flavobacteriales bacterium]|nr:glycosyltransferase family 4 protein [Flavobacteriales bacterium]
MKTILITAYAVNPFKGSEDGTGWNFAYHAAKINKVVLFTRENNKQHIERYIQENEHDQALQNIKFYYFDLPNWVLKLKKRSGERGYVIYFWLWQYFIVNRIKKLNLEFDIAHGLNFHSDSQPMFLWKLGKPTIWGPIGHHPPISNIFIRKFPVKELVRDRLYLLVKWMFRNLDPFFRKSVRKTDKIIAINSSVAEAIGVNESKITVLPAVGCDYSLNRNISHDLVFNVLSIGRFVPMKGFDLTISAFSKFIYDLPKGERNRVKLKLIGKGPQYKRLKKLAIKLNIDQHIDWIAWVNKCEVEAYYKNAAIFLFPSHEGAGMVVPEAMSYGLPVVCIDNVGPGELINDDAGIKISANSRSQVIDDLASSIMLLYCNSGLRSFKGQEAVRLVKNKYDWSKKSLQLQSIYNDLLYGENEIMEFELDIKRA